MCFAFDARPPALPADLVLPPMAGGAAAELVELTSADGTAFSAAFAGTPEPRGCAVVVLPDVRGLFRFYVELAERFAQAGHHAIAIDYFGRTAGTGERDEDFDFWPHVNETQPDTVQADIAAAVAFLRERAGDEVRIATVGFCFGGRQSFMAAAAPELDLDRVVGFYGGLAARSDAMPAPAVRAAQTRVPVLGLFGGEDQSIPAEDRDAFEAGLRESGAEHEFVVYPGAPHSFFDRSYEEFADECEDAWRRTLAFLG